MGELYENYLKDSLKDVLVKTREKTAKKILGMFYGEVLEGFLEKIPKKSLKIFKLNSGKKKLWMIPQMNSRRNF